MSKDLEETLHLEPQRTLNVREDSSTASTYKLPAEEVEFCKRSSVLPT
ncbi:MAG: palindromic element RPE1 domain-containing protein [Rickettsia endosymbiont of Culicoides impunctatus]|nr:MAG: palindromic element RPE1 domain-containing protein [Rickettsia endosymbiont of Culicoides impunctatus]